MFQRNLLPGTFHPVLLGKGTNKAVTDKQYTKVLKITPRAISAVKGIVPVRYPAGFPNA
jgi:hypothetical protein